LLHVRTSDDAGLPAEEMRAVEAGMIGVSVATLVDMERKRGIVEADAARSDSSRT